VEIGGRFEACAGVPGSPQRASAVKDEARQSGGTRYEGMKKVIREIVQTRTLYGILNFRVGTGDSRTGGGTCS